MAFRNGREGIDIEGVPPDFAAPPKRSKFKKAPDEKMIGMVVPPPRCPTGL